MRSSKGKEDKREKGDKQDREEERGGEIWEELDKPRKEMKLYIERVKKMK